MGNIKIIFQIIFVCLIFSSTSAIGSEKGESMFDLNKDSVGFLLHERIFFGHQSVGENILNGIEMVAPNFKDHTYDMKNLSINDYSKSGLFHSRIGNNHDPKSKIAEFDRIVRERFNGKLDIAFVKLCFVDINRDSDIVAIFDYYKKTLQDLEETYPNIKFVHFTLPLRTNAETWKTKLKKLLGRGNLWEYADNIKRNQYSQLLLDEYQGKEPVFDLSKIESTDLDGKRVTFTVNGQTYYALADELSTDGGHLNEQGSRIVASNLLEFLFELK